MYAFILPVFIVMGIIGNSITLCVFRRDRMRKMSVCFYLSAYALDNILTTLVTSFMEWIHMVVATPHITHWTDWGCKLWQFSIRVVIYAGAWIIVAMTADRFLSLWYPKKSVTVCTVFWAKFAVSLILIGLVFVSVHAMWTYEVITEGCFPAQGDLHAQIWPWLSGGCYSFLPLALIFLLDNLLLVKMCMKRNCPPDFTFTVFSLSLLFALLATPATVINVVDFSLSRNALEDSEFMKTLDTVRIVCQLFAFLNPSGLFWVCLAVSKKFRAELCEMIIGCRVRKKEHVKIELVRNGNSAELESEQLNVMEISKV